MKQIIQTFKRTEKECPHCFGSGVYYAPNGSDDVSPEECPCQITTEEEDRLEAHCQKIHGFGRDRLKELLNK